jgi:hypothetical protein
MKRDFCHEREPQSGSCVWRRIVGRAAYDHQPTVGDDQHHLNWGHLLVRSSFEFPIQSGTRVLLLTPMEPCPADVNHDHCVNIDDLLAVINAMSVRTLIMLFIVAGPCLSSPIASATVVEYVNKAQWEAAAGAFSTIHFTELPDNTLVTTQYASLGVTFTDGSDYIYHSSSFVIDGAGLNGALNSTYLAFGAPMASVAIDFPGGAKFELYSSGQLIYTSTHFGGSGVGHFAGLVSDVPFDAARVFDPEGGFFMDDLHFGPSVPAPGALSLLGPALFMAANRRRRR